MLNSNFAGQDFPVGSLVEFEFKGEILEGEVTKLMKRQARVVTDKGSYKVGYGNLDLIEQSMEPEMPLDLIESYADDMFRQYGLHEQGWTFGFEVTVSRGGVCDYTNKQIRMSVSYCLKADAHDIRDTVLHEMAHALVGPGHNHDRVWRAMARSIGCSGDVTTNVRIRESKLSKYVGSCDCSNAWTRNRLTKRARRVICSECKSSIDWRIRRLSD